MNTAKLHEIMIEKGIAVKDMAKLLCISDSTFYRKMKTGYFLIGEVELIKKALHLSNEEAIWVFFED
ncbi:hypothetical protein [Guggenheimella bovis]